MKEKFILLTDADWSVIDGYICRVKSFTPMLSLVKDGKVKSADTTTPYATISIECTKLSGEITGFITHKKDFINLWNAFKERGVQENEEVLISWSIKHYKIKIFKVLHVGMPKIWVMICPKNAFELMTDDNYRPEFRGEARWRAAMPIIQWKPESIE